MEKIIVTLPKKVSLTQRISEASIRVREWLKDLEVAYNDEKDKLQLSRWESKNNEYHYHYSIIKRDSISAFKAKAQIMDNDM